MERLTPSALDKILEVLKKHNVTKFKGSDLEVEFSPFAEVPPKTLELDEVVDEIDPAYKEMKKQQAQDSYVDDTNKAERSSEFDIHTALKSL